MVEPRGDNIENFANSLVKKLVLEAMNVLDLHSEEANNYWRRYHANCETSGCAICRDRKIRNLALREAQLAHQNMESTVSCHGDQVRASEQTEFSQSGFQSSDLWTNDGNFPFDVDQRASDEIRKIVQGLQGVQIGDSTFVRPLARVPSLEIEVKRAVEDLSHVSEIVEISEVPFIEGQDYVQDQGLPEITPAAAVIEVDNEIGSSLPEEMDILDDDNANNRQMQRQVQQLLQQQQEVAKLRSTCFLHRIIKELENAEANQENVLKVTNSISGISQERIAAWEESEEKFIRTIEGAKNDSVEDEIDDSFAISLIDDVPAGTIVEVEIQEIDSTPASPTLKPPSLPPPAALPPAPPNESTMMQHETKLEKSKTTNKMRLGKRLRKFFRSAFKRGKDC